MRSRRPPPWKACDPVVLLIMFAALLVLLALRVPVWIALLIPSVVYIILDDTATAGLAAQQTASGVFDFAILAVPMFILLGNLAKDRKSVV